MRGSRAQRRKSEIRSEKVAAKFDFAFRNRNRNRNRNLLSHIFDHEQLEVYRPAMAFLDWLEPLLQELPKSLAVVNKLGRANTSIPLNIVGARTDCGVSFRSGSV